MGFRGSRVQIPPSRLEQANARQPVRLSGIRLLRLGPPVSSLGSSFPYSSLVAGSIAASLYDYHHPVIVRLYLGAQFLDRVVDDQSQPGIENHRQ